MIQAPYFSDAEVEDLISRPNGPPTDQVKVWALFVRIGTSGGHPLLTAAKIAGLRARGWPSAALTEDLMGAPSEAGRATREEARRRLLQELKALDDARSLDAGRLLRRLGSVVDRVNDELALRLARADPPIATAGDALAILRGSWLEILPGGDFRISPLISDIANDVSGDVAQGWRQLAAEYWLSTRVLNERTLPPCFWNAFLGKHAWVLLMLCTVIETLPNERLRVAAALLSPMVYFRTDTPMFPENPVIAAHLRMLQFDVAEAIENSEIAGKIATRLFVEIEQIDHEEIRAMLMSVAAQKILMAEHARIEPAERLSTALRLRAVAPTVAKLGGESTQTFIAQFEIGFGKNVDIAGFLYAYRAARTRSSEETLATVRALDQLAPNDRMTFLEALNALFSGYSIFVHSGWASDQLADRELAVALGIYQEIESIVRRWNVDDLSIDLVCARSVILDEGVDDQTAAIATIDQAIGAFGPEPKLVRQKAKVLAHVGRDIDAVRLVLEIEDSIGRSEPFERALALRDGAVSAARCRMWDEAVRLLDKASTALTTAGAAAGLSVGLKIERALVLWEATDRIGSLATIADVFDLLEALPPSESRQNEHVHQVGRLLVGMFMHDLLPFPTDARPIIAFGVPSTLTDQAALLNLDLKPLADNWRIMALVEIRAGVDVGIGLRSQAKQSGHGIASIEAMICAALYWRALQTGDAREAMKRGIEATSAAKVERDLPPGDRSQRRVASDVLTSLSASALMGYGWGEAVLRLPVDFLVVQRMRGSDIAADLKDLGIACDEAFGAPSIAEPVLRAASGIYAIGNGAQLPVALAHYLRRSDAELKSDPGMRFTRDILLTAHVASSVAYSALAEPASTKMASGWQDVLATQRFVLRSPALHCPDMEAAVRQVPATGIRGIARLLLAAVPALGVQLSDTWADVLRGIAKIEP